MDSLIFAYLVIHLFERFQLADFFFTDHRDHPRLRHITTANLALRRYLPATSYTHFRQWVVKVGDNEYLGLTTSGPRIMSAVHWAHYSQIQLLRWSKVQKIEFSMDKFTRSLINDLHHLDKLNLWRFQGSSTVNLGDFTPTPIPRLTMLERDQEQCHQESDQSADLGSQQASPMNVETPRNISWIFEVEDLKNHQPKDLIRDDDISERLIVIFDVTFMVPT
jgi:hypothetical protein